jgi:hypothetical protein
VWPKNTRTQNGRLEKASVEKLHGFRRRRCTILSSPKLAKNNMNFNQQKTSHIARNSASNKSDPVAGSYASASYAFRTHGQHNSPKTEQAPETSTRSDDWLAKNVLQNGEFQKMCFAAAQSTAVLENTWKPKKPKPTGKATYAMRTNSGWFQSEEKDPRDQP